MADMEAPSYTAYLKEHIPTWLSKLALVAAATEKTPESSGSSRDFRYSQAEDPLYGLANKHLRWRERQGPSNRPLVTSTPTNQLAKHGSGKSNHGPHSDDSSILSGVNHYRARNAISVLYDSTTQNILEALVDEVNVARGLIVATRNELEKELSNIRMLSTLQQKIGFGGQDDEETSDNDLDNMLKPGRRESLDKDFMLAKMRKRTRPSASTRSLAAAAASASLRSSAQPRPQEENPPQKAKVERLDLIDTCLQQAQDICTGAAYQLLRDGQCSWETKATSDKLSEVWMAVKEDEPQAEPDESVSPSGSDLGHNDLLVRSSPGAVQRRIQGGSGSEYAPTKKTSYTTYQSSHSNDGGDNAGTTAALHRGVDFPTLSQDARSRQSRPDLQAASDTRPAPRWHLPIVVPGSSGDEENMRAHPPASARITATSSPVQAVHS